MSYCVIDLETSIKKSYGRVANPFDKDNYIVAAGCRESLLQDETGLRYYDPNKRLEETMRFPNDTKVLVGHNIKFDLLYLWKSKSLQDWLIQGGKIWDTALAEYMLSGQVHTYPSLNNCAIKYGGTVKDERIKALWEAGCDTKDIPKDMLLEYLAYDVKNTELVYLAQLDELKNNSKLLKLIELQMDALLATTEMEFNGMHIDKDRAQINYTKLKKQLEAKDQQITEYIETKLNVPSSIINLNSNQHVSCLFFGGTIKTTKKVKDGLYKSGEKKGQVKYKNMGIEVKCPNIADSNTDTSGTRSVNVEVLTSVSKESKSTIARKLATDLLQRRGLAKELNTYYKSMVRLVQNDGLIHHSLNHTATATGRLSSTKPNLQNIPRDSGNPNDVKTIFSSRFIDGSIIEIDYSGAEVVAAAFESQDLQMIRDLESGADPHTENASKIYNINKDLVTKEQRQAAKIASFQLLYGAGARKIAHTQFNGDEEVAEAFVSAYYNRYKCLKEWQNTLIERVKNERQAGTSKTNRGYPAGVSTITSSTGRRYTFTEYDTPKFLRDRGQLAGFSPTEVKNYLIQGLATADIVPIMLGKLFRAFITLRDKVLLINTVHDSVLLDCKKEYLTEISMSAKLILKDVRKVLYDELGINFNVPVDVDVKCGLSWGTLKNIDLNRGEDINDNAIKNVRG